MEWKIHCYPTRAFLGMVFLRFILILSSFKNAFASEVCADLADKRQHDAQEFQIYLLNALHEDMNKVSCVIFEALD